MTIHLRKSGGAKIVSLPSAYLKRLGWDVGQELDIKLVDNKILIEANEDELTLESLLHGCTPEILQPSSDDQEWLNMKAAGKEI